MSTAGDRLITAGPDSRLQMFKITTSELGKRGKGLEHLGECVLDHHKLVTKICGCFVLLMFPRLKS